MIPKKKTNRPMDGVSGTPEGAKGDQGDETFTEPEKATDYFDYVDDQQADYKRAASDSELPEANAPVTDMPAVFEKVSICASGGGCRWFFRLKHPVRIKMFDQKTDTGQTRMMAVTRRCLVGAVKLDSDDPITASVMKNLGTEAPYGATECSHYTPWSDEEIADREARLDLARERDTTDKAMDAALVGPRPAPAPRPMPEPEDPFDPDTRSA